MFRFLSGALGENARRLPRKAVFIENGTETTWEAWESTVGQLAAGLAALSVGAGTRVAVRTGTRREWFDIHAALSHLGATMVTVNCRATPEEVGYMLQDSEASLFILDDEDPTPFESLWPASKGQLIAFHPASEGMLDFAKLRAAQGPTAPLDFDAPAGMIMYTSGTTGKPKGLFRDPAAMQANRSLMDEVFAEFDTIMPRDPSTRTLLCHPMHHTAGTQTCLDTLYAGGSIVIQSRFEAEETLRLIEAHGITASMMVPTMLHRIRALPQGTLEKYNPRSLRVFELGGAPVPQTLKDWASTYFGPQCGIYEAYGASEMYLVAYTSPADSAAFPGSSGKILKSLEVAIVGSDGDVLGCGETGEICARTPMLIDGYLNQPKLSVERGDLTREGLFRTGDVGFLDAHGHLFITGRIKDMIVSGGVNIYPAEVEQALIAHPEVLDAAVVGAPNDEFGEEVVAFCQLRPDADITPDALVAFCRGQIAGYKCPKRIHFLQALPRNESGKVLKRTLRDPLWATAARKI